VFRVTPAADEPLSIGQALRWIAFDPWAALCRRWNYKAAILSSLMRAGLFCAINATAGLDAAMSAMTTELLFRFTTSGFYGAMTQAFRRVEPAGAATFAVMILLPLVSHSLEFVVHVWRGTIVLATSIGASVALTAISTAFNLFAMRHGALVTGHDHRSLAADLAEMPRLLALFVVTVARRCARR
jgi:hypothetical protein